jgi:DNA-binding transcriptional ArsR family regulator
MAVQALRTLEQEENAEEILLDRVFFALSDPVRRTILLRLGEEVLLVSELAAPFDISLQAVSKHIQVLVRAGLVTQERSGRISRCRLDAGPILDAAVWINRYSKYWQEQFDLLALALVDDDRKHSTKPQGGRRLRAARPTGRSTGQGRDRRRAKP